MTSMEIRQSFLDFFKERGHEIVPSSPVVIPSDPSLLFANAGMNQFKDLFLGVRESQYQRIADTQKCIRVSGKHNDLEEVGRDTYHHTFFEMLGNWSIGDYYKTEAITWAWELLTEVWALPKDRLWATVYRDDDEAAQLWKELTDIDPAHILPFDEKDNFWEMGETGPCGPCSEIHIDLTADGCTPELVNAGSPEVIELWNLVFIQHNRRSDGTLEDLPSKHIDTGMGFERLCAVLQGKKSNYDTDVFMPLLEGVQELTGRAYKGEDAVAMRVIADHLRTLSFAMADGVAPSNEGRGYVLRRLLRRAVRYGRTLGLRQPFLGRLFPVLEQQMGAVFPELTERRDTILQALSAEEESFAATLDRGLTLFEEVATDLKQKGEHLFPGESAFKLYDTFGFPIDLTRLMAEERELTVDEEAFESLMEAQRERARGAQKDSLAGRMGDVTADLIQRGVSSGFTGYDRFEDEAEVKAIVVDGEICDSAAEGAEALVVLDRTPFYGESGGQVGDSGVLRSSAAEVDVKDTQKPGEGLILHVCNTSKGTLSVGDRVSAEVDRSRRDRIMRHHTATHLLNFALRNAVDPQIKQAGSMVAPDRFRFDFNHASALAADRIEELERIVNGIIMDDLDVSTYTLPFSEVAGSGITAVFDEKYGDTVRVIDIAGQSRELCGGTHVARTGAIGSFRIVAESSVAAGIRRIEAVCGWPAFEWTRREHDLLQGLSRRLATPTAELFDRVEMLLQQNKQLEKDLKAARTQSTTVDMDDLLSKIKDIDGTPVLAADLGDMPMDTLRGMMDKLRGRLTSGLIVLGAVSDGKAAFMATVSSDLMDRGIHAGRLVGAVAKIAGGGGGGKPNSAQAGAKDGSKVPDAIAAVSNLVREQIG